jgi:hypothetical protein
MDTLITERHEQPSPTPAPPPLTLMCVTVLTDAAMHVFGVLHGIEIEARRSAKERLMAELARLDLFAPEPDHTDYVPGGGASWI